MESRQLHPTLSTVLMLQTAPHNILCGACVELASRLMENYFASKGQLPENISTEDAALALEEFIRLALRASLKQLRPDLERRCQELEADAAADNAECNASPEQRSASEQEASRVIARAARVDGNGTKH